MRTAGRRKAHSLGHTKHTKNRSLINTAHVYSQNITQREHHKRWYPLTRWGEHIQICGYCPSSVISWPTAPQRICRCAVTRGPWLGHWRFVIATQSEIFISPQTMPWIAFTLKLVIFKNATMELLPFINCWKYIYFELNHNTNLIPLLPRSAISRNIQWGRC